MIKNWLIDGVDQSTNMDHNPINGCHLHGQTERGREKREILHKKINTINFGSPIRSSIKPEIDEKTSIDDQIDQELHKRRSDWRRRLCQLDSITTVRSLIAVRS